MTLEEVKEETPDGKKRRKPYKKSPKIKNKGNKDEDNKATSTFDKNPELRKKATELSKTPEALAKQSQSQKISKAISKVRTETDVYLRDEWYSPDATGISNAHKFIQNMVKQAIDDPDSYAAKYFLDKMVGADVLTRLDKTLEEEQNKNIDFQLYRIRQTLFDKQQEIFDNKQDKLIMNFSGRRWGKSEVNQRILLRHALTHKDSKALYINRNQDNALTQGYDTMIKILDALAIPYNGTRGLGIIALNNGTEIYYRGASNSVDIDKFRGVAKMCCAIIDEAGHLKGLSYLLREILQPATMDIADSQIILTGTPPRSKNYAYNLWNNGEAKIKRYNNNFLSNPFIPNRDTVLEDVAALYGVPVDSAFIRREYLGDMNALDDDARIFINYIYRDESVYKSEQFNKTYERLFFGIDWGYQDDAAIVVFVADKQNKQLIQLDEWHAPHKATSEIAATLKEMYTKWTEKVQCAKLPYIICDTNEKDNVLNLATAYHFKNVLCAYKYNKNVGLKQLSSLMNTGNILIQKNSYLDDEAQNMLWKRDEETDKIIEEVDDEAYHANGMFALLYISRQFALDIMGYTDYNKEAKDILNENR